MATPEGQSEAVKCAASDCEVVFVPSRPSHLYHSNACNQRERRRVREAPTAPGEQECAAPDCTQRFVPKRKSQIYHDKACGQRVSNASRSGGLTLDDALAASHAKDVEQSQRQELKKATALESRIRRYLEVLETSVAAYEPTPLVVQQPKDKALPLHEMILATGDWHTGMKMQIHETGGIYEQNVETTRQQVFKLFDRVQRLLAIQSSGVRVQKLHLIGLGDLIEGDDMRPSQHRHIEDVMTVQTIQAMDLFSWLIRQLLTLVEEVEVDMVGGNHDRTGRNKGNAGLGELDYADTMSWLIGEFCKRLFENEPRVKIRNWNTFFGYKLVAGQKLVFEHGSSIKWNAGSYGGVPWYGVSQLPAKYAAMLGAADITIMGHGHRPAILPDGRGWLVINGALPATSGFEQSNFKTVRRPLQWLMNIHEEHGLVGWQPIYLDVPGTILPGTVWEDPERFAELANQRATSWGSGG